jgi:hypothetical protein
MLSNIFMMELRIFIIIQVHDLSKMRQKILLISFNPFLFLSPSLFSPLFFPVPLNFPPCLHDFLYSPLLVKTVPSSLFFRSPVSSCSSSFIHYSFPILFMCPPCRHSSPLILQMVHWVLPPPERGQLLYVNTGTAIQLTRMRKFRSQVILFFILVHSFLR